jgi:hypothetical protein
MRALRDRLPVGYPVSTYPVPANVYRRTAAGEGVNHDIERLGVEIKKPVDDTRF